MQYVLAVINTCKKDIILFTIYGLSNFICSRIHTHVQDNDVKYTDIM